MRNKDLSQPATRVDTTCWQSFRPDINTAHFLFFVAEVMSSYGLKKFLYFRRPLRPEVRGMCHMDNLALLMSEDLRTDHVNFESPSILPKNF